MTRSILEHEVFTFRGFAANNHREVAGLEMPWKVNLPVAIANEGKGSGWSHNVIMTRTWGAVVKALGHLPAERMGNRTPKYSFHLPPGTPSDF